MRYCIECTVSGVGQDFEGTLKEAITLARNSIRQVGWRQAIWLQPANSRVAVVWEENEWISTSFLNRCTG